MNKFMAAVFDLDGTLLDTLQDIAESMNQVLLEMGFPQHPVQSYKMFVGGGMRVLVRKTLPEESRTEAVIDKCLSAMKETYASRWANKTMPYDGITDMLLSLREMNFKLAVLSNKPHEFTVESVIHFFGANIFDIIIGGGKFPSKPDPSSAIFISEQLMVPAEQIIYLGDSGIDMMTATGAGMFAVGALWGFRSREELIAEGADLLIKTPQELTEYLQHGK